MSILIPGLILDDENLQIEHKMVLGVLYTLSNMYETIFISNKALAQETHLPIQKIPNIITYLVRLDYIEVFFHENKRGIKFEQRKAMILNFCMSNTGVPDNILHMH